MATNVALPQGFVLDEQNSSGLPSGFVLDEQPKPRIKQVTQSKPKVQTQPQTKPVVQNKPLAETNIKTQKIYNGVNADILNNPNLTKLQKAVEIQKRGEAERKEYGRENLKTKGRIGLGLALQGASMLPVFNVPFVGTGIGGAMFDAGSAIIEGKSGKDIAKQAGRGFIIGETVGAVPYVGKAAAKTKAGQAVGRAVAKAGEQIANTQVGKAVGRALTTEIPFSKSMQVGRKAKPEQLKSQTAEQQAQKLQELERQKQPNIIQEINQEPIVNEAVENIPFELKTSAKIADNLPTSEPEIEKLTKASMQKELNAQIRQLKNEFDIPELPKRPYYRRLYKGKNYTKTVPLSAEEEMMYKPTETLINEIKAIKKNPEIINSEGYLEAAEARLAKELDNLPIEAQGEIYNNFYKAYENANKINALKAKGATPEALGYVEDIPVGRTGKRGATETVRKYYGDDVANQITDTDYAVRGRKVLENEYNNATPEMKQALLQSDKLDDLTIYAQAQSIKDNIAQGNIPTAELNRWVKKGTEQGQAFQARQFIAPDTVEGAAVQAQKYFLDAQPKNVQKIVEDIPQIKKKLQDMTNEEAEQKFNQWLNKQPKEIKQKTEQGNKLALLKGMEKYRQREIKRLQKQADNAFSYKQKQALKAQQALEKEELSSIKALQKEAEQRERKIEQLIGNRVLSSKTRKNLAQKIMELQDLGGMNEENLTKLINKEFKIPELNAQNIKRFEELTANIRNTKGYDNDVAVQRLSKYITSLQPASKMKKLKAVRNIAMLLNPKTLGRNIVGNVLFNTIDTGAKALAVPFDRAIGAFTGLRTRVAPQIGASIKGSLQGGAKGVKEAVEGIDTRGLGQRFDLGQGRVFENPIGQGFETALDIGLRVPDRMTYEGAFAESVANQMLANDITSKELRDLFAKGASLDDILAKAPQEILERANKEALEAVFQNESAMSNFALGARKLLNIAGTKDFGVGDLFIPYAQTPGNLTQQAINYSPLGFIKGAWNWTIGDQRQAALDFARGTLGTGLIGGGYALGKAGLATPSQFADNYAENKRMKENLELLGIRPNQIGNYQYGYFQPMSTSLAAGVAAAQGKNSIGAALNTIVDMPYLQNLNRFIQDSQYQDPWYAAGRFASTVPQQWVPTLSSQFGQYYDPYMRETYDPNMFKQGLNQAINKIPVARTKLPIRYDVKGQPKMTTAVNEHPVFDTFFNPTFVNEQKNDPVVQEALRLQETTGENTLLPVPEKSYNFYNPETKKKEKRKLTSKEYNQYSQKLGQTTYGMLDYIQSLPLYNNLTDKEKADLNETVKKVAKSAVQENLFGTPEEKRQKLIDDFLKKHPDSRTKALKQIKKMLKDDVFPIKVQEFYNKNNEIML